MKRKKWTLIAVLLFCVAGVAATFFNRAIPAGNWGLSFRTEGQAPVGNADVKQLQKYNSAYLGDTSKKVVYLTFDAGYENGCTEKILDILKKHEIKAAFFLVGNYMERNADLVRRMVNEGHIVGNHTMHHYNMEKISDPAAFAEELQELEKLFLDITGKELPKYYRPPQGIYSEENLKMAQDLGYKTVFWSLAYADWDNNSQMSEKSALKKIIDNIHNGEIMLLHPTSATNAKIMKSLITELKSMGYRFATLEELK